MRAAWPDWASPSSGATRPTRRTFAACCVAPKPSWPSWAPRTASSRSACTRKAPEPSPAPWPTVRVGQGAGDGSGAFRVQADRLLAVRGAQDGHDGFGATQHAAKVLRVGRVAPDDGDAQSGQAARIEVPGERPHRVDGVDELLGEQPPCGAVRSENGDEHDGLPALVATH